MDRKLRGSFVILFGLVFLFSIAASSPAEERILNFHSDVVIQPDGDLIVTEEIEVRAEKKKIVRGIYRDFPTVRRDPDGRVYRVGFEVREVLRDGRPEDYHVVRAGNSGNSVRVYIGHRDNEIDYGEHTYTFRYRTTCQIHFFADYDELYWNVTGNYWSFPIDQASALVAIPNGEDGDKGILSYEAFTGALGETGTDYEAELDGPSRVRFTTTRRFEIQEGLTFRIRFSKGLVREPEDGLEYPFWKNWGRTVAIASFLLGVFYYIFAWRKVGIDPRKGTIQPRREPPEGFSPEALRYIKNMGYDNEVFSSALINMASKGYLVIDEEGDDYVLRRDWADESVLTEEEKVLAENLFPGRREIEMTRSNRTEIQEAIDSFKQVLRLKCEGPYFSMNRPWLFPGALILAFAVFAAILGTPPEVTLEAPPMIRISLFHLALMPGWVVFLTWALCSGVRDLRSPGASGGSSRGTGILMVAISLPLVIIIVAASSWMTSFVATILAFGSTVLIHLFRDLLRAPTPRGRELLDQLEGFEVHLAGEDRSPLVFSSREKATSTYEEYLPYAVALGKEDEWTREFTESISEACRVPAAHRPVWCRSVHLGGGGIAGLGAAVSAGLAGAAASASSSGGGGSGGGGGGGGGGGW